MIFLFRAAYLTPKHRESGDHSWLWTGSSPSKGTRAHTHTANQPTAHVFGLGKETGEPGRNQGEHVNSTHTGWRRDSNPPVQGECAEI